MVWFVQNVNPQNASVSLVLFHLNVKNLILPCGRLSCPQFRLFVLDFELLPTPGGCKVNRQN